MKTKKLLALVLAVLTVLSLFSGSVLAADIPSVENLRMRNVENGVCDGSFELSWQMLDDMSRMKISGVKIMGSTDQSNWFLAYETGDRYAAYATIREFEDGSKPVSGTTYYFYVFYVGKNGEDGPKSSIVSGKFANSDADLRTDWEAVMAGYKTPTTEKGVKYNKEKLVKGETVTWDNGLYTLTAAITAVTASQATVKVSMKNKTGCTYECSFLSWNGIGGMSHGESMDVYEGSKTVKINLEYLKDGANYFKFTISGYGNPVSKYSSVAKGSEYRDYSDDLLYIGREHTLYFQKAPDTPGLDFRGANLKINSKAISFGSAYKSSSEASKASGTIVYYKEASAKKWSKKAFAAGKTLAISKLKANTDYQIRIANFVKSVSAADNKTVVTSTSALSNILKFRTGIATAPEIKSVKISSKVVKVHHNAEWWYNGVKWIYKEAYDTTQTNFTVTVTLTSAPKGMNALQCSGLGAQNSEIKEGKGTTFTFTGTRAGNAKGKKITLSFLSYTNILGSGWYAGTSPAAKKSVTL